MSMDDFERRVQAEIDRLDGPEFPRGRLAKRQRDETVRALAQATVIGRSWTGDKGALGKGRPTMVVGESAFYSKKHWWAHPLTREVIGNVTELYKARDAAEREQARLKKRDWLERKELEAAAAQFDKAHELLALPSDVANSAAFNTADKLNESGSKLGRRALGLPLDTSRSETEISTAAPIRMTADLSGMDEKAIDTIIDNLTAALGGSVGGADSAQDAAGAGDDREAEKADRI